MSKMNDVIVIGGGFGGLLVACEIARRGGQPLLLEASPTPGGVASTISEDGYSLEPAAGSILLPNAFLSPILAAASANLTPATSAARRRYVYNKGKLFGLSGPRSIATPLISVRGKARMLKEPWVASSNDPTEESLRSFLERRLGNETGRIAATLMAHGVFAGDPEQISAQAAFPGLVDLEQEAGSLLRGGLAKRRNREAGTTRPTVHVPTEGMSVLAKELSTYLGESFRADWPVTSIEFEDDSWTVRGPTEEHAPKVVIALPPGAAKKLVPAPLGTVLGDAVSSPVAIVGLGGKDVDVPALPGFGALIGPDTDLQMLGLLFESSYAPGRASKRHCLLKAIFGGAADPSAFALSDEELIALAIDEAGRVMGTVIQPSWTHVARHADGIPQYQLDHMAWLGRVNSALITFPGLFVAGWGYRGIGLASLAKDAVQLVDTLGES